MLETLYKIAFNVARALTIDGKPTPDDPDCQDPLYSYNPKGNALSFVGDSRFQTANLRQSPADRPAPRTAARER